MAICCSIDAGAEYKGYASDITRTFPINGRYTKPQREIYDLVLKAQRRVLRWSGRALHTTNSSNTRSGC